MKKEGERRTFRAILMTEREDITGENIHTTQNISYITMSMMKVNFSRCIMQNYKILKVITENSVCKISL